MMVQIILAAGVILYLINIVSYDAVSVRYIFWLFSLLIYILLNNHVLFMSSFSLLQTISYWLQHKDYPSGY